LTRCDGALVFVGEAPESWLRTKLMELQKAAGYGRQQPMAAKGIWMTSPPASFKERFRTREAIVIKGDRPSLESLTPFLDGLGKVSQ
jgi:hypothetical protein